MPIDLDHAGGAKSTTLTSSINATATTITVTDGTGWPTGAGGKFYATIERGQAGEERILVLSRSVNTLLLESTADRGVDGTAAASHGANVDIEHGLSATEAAEANAHLMATTGVHGVTGALAGVTATQTLTNKTITAPTISSPTITGTVGGNPTITAPTISGPTISGPTITGTIAGSPTITAPTITGTVAGSPTITTPTLTAPVIADFTSAQHDHLDGDDAGLLTQAATHQSPDTDTASGSLHHTLGASATQAAAGNHSHSDPWLFDFAWNSYTPAWTSNGTAPSLGNGTITGHYKGVGKLFHVSVELTIGSTTTVGTGQYSFSLPPATTARGGRGQGLTAWVIDDSGSDRWAGTAYLESGGAVVSRIFLNGTASLSSNVPLTLAAGDKIGFAGMFEQA